MTDPNLLTGMLARVRDTQLHGCVCCGARATAEPPLPEDSLVCTCGGTVVRLQGPTPPKVMR